MSKCPMHKLRSDLPPLPPRIAKLPVDERGYPVPFFVTWLDGKPEFRAADARKWGRCVNENLCWVCGRQLGMLKTFAIGPMCAITRTTAEPPSHPDCAEWSAMACPFLSKPKMVRREDAFLLSKRNEVAGEMIDRNPGVTCLWTVRDYTMFPDGKGKLLFDVGDPEAVSWWREGRRATRAEIDESIDTGIPELFKTCATMLERGEVVAYRRRLELSGNMPTD